jgi:hypothetical protein
MEAERTSETSVYSSETTRRYIPEGSDLHHTRRRENLESHNTFHYKDQLVKVVQVNNRRLF